jgi:hypothetical protein
VLDWKKCRFNEDLENAFAQSSIDKEKLSTVISLIGLNNFENLKECMSLIIN